MTTNKPTTYWAPSTALHKLASRHNNAPCILTDGPAEFNDVAMVRLSDYETLQAECEKLREHLQNLIDQTTPLEPVPGNPMWSRRIQLDEVIAERDSLRAECEKLRKDAEKARVRIKELDLLFGRYLLGMKSAVIEAEHGKGAEAGMAWIWNGLVGPGELPPDDETDAQAFFDREIKAINDGMSEVMAFYRDQRAAMQGDKP